MGVVARAELVVKSRRELRVIRNHLPRLLHQHVSEAKTEATAIELRSQREDLPNLIDDRVLARVPAVVVARPLEGSRNAWSTSTLSNAINAEKLADHA